MRHAALLTALVGCIDASNPPTEGIDGVLTFTDETQQPDGVLGASGLGRNVAVGAVVDVGVYGWNPDDGDLGGALLDGDAFAFVVDTGPVLRLRALHAGTARLGVVTADARQDEVTLTAEDVQHAEIADHGFGLLVTPPSAFADAGLAALPGAEILLAVYTYGATGRLTGAHGLTWSHPEGSQILPASSANAGRLVADAAPGEHVVTAGWDSAWTLHQLAADAPVTLALTTSDVDDPQPLSRVDATESFQLLGLRVTDAAGRYVMAPDNAVTAEVIDGPEDLLRVDGSSSVLGGFMATLCPGEGTVRLQVAGGTLDVPVSFPAPAEPVAGCDA